MVSRDKLFETVKEVAKAGYQSQMTSVGVLDQIQMNQKVHDAIDRANAQADAQLKKCNPDYEPPEKSDGMGDIINIISGNVVSDEDAFANLVDKTCKDPSHQTPETNPAPEKKPITETPPAKPDPLSLLGKVPWLQLATVAGLAYGGWQLSRPQYVDVPARSTTIDAEFLSEIEGKLK